MSFLSASSSSGSFRFRAKSGVVARGSKSASGLVTLSLVSTAALAAGLWVAASTSAPVEEPTVAAPAGKAQSVVAKIDPLLAPGFSLGVAARPLAQSAPLAAELVRTAAPVVAKVETPVVIAALAPAPAQAAPEDEEDDEDVVASAPLPLPRPPELRLPEQPRAAVPLTPRRSRVAAAPAAPVDDRSIFEKIFGVQRQPNGPALAYAAPQDDPSAAARSAGLCPPRLPRPA